MIFGFGRTPIIDQETIDWEFETYRWLFENFGGYPQFRGAELVQPTDGFFPVEKGLAGHALAEAIFAQVKRHARMDQWPCRLVAQESDPELLVGDAQLLQGFEPSPAGTFSVDPQESRTDDAVVITYNPKLLSDSMSLVATFAHELSHFLIATAQSLPPGEEELLEFATDLTAVYLGFGVFMANSSFRFEQHGDAFSMGWQASRQGYMTERQLVFALAIFAHLLDLPAAAVCEHLKPNLAKLFGRAGRTLEREAERLAELRAIDAG